MQIVARGTPPGCSPSPEGQGITAHLIEMFGWSHKDHCPVLLSLSPRSLQERCRRSGKALILKVILDFKASGCRGLGQLSRFPLPSRKCHPPCLQTIALGRMSLQHRREIPGPILVPAPSIAVDSHASQRVVAASRILFLATIQIVFSSERGARISLRQDDLPTAGQNGNHQTLEGCVLTSVW